VGIGVSSAIFWLGVSGWGWVIFSGLAGLFFFRGLVGSFEGLCLGIPVGQCYPAGEVSWERGGEYLLAAVTLGCWDMRFGFDSWDSMMDFM
jgi:hypothetical protein